MRSVAAISIVASVLHLVVAAAQQKLTKAYKDAIKRSTQRGDLVTANAMLEEKSALESALEEDVPAPEGRTTTCSSKRASS